MCISMFRADRVFKLLQCYTRWQWRDLLMWNWDFELIPCFSEHSFTNIFIYIPPIWKFWQHCSFSFIISSFTAQYAELEFLFRLQKIGENSVLVFINIKHVIIFFYLEMVLTVKITLPSFLHNSKLFHWLFLYRKTCSQSFLGKCNLEKNG